MPLHTVFFVALLITAWSTQIDGKLKHRKKVRSNGKLKHKKKVLPNRKLKPTQIERKLKNRKKVLSHAKILKHRKKVLSTQEKKVLNHHAAKYPKRAWGLPWKPDTECPSSQYQSLYCALCLQPSIFFFLLLFSFFVMIVVNYFVGVQTDVS